MSRKCLAYKTVVVPGCRVRAVVSKAAVVAALRQHDEARLRQRLRLQNHMLQRPRLQNPILWMRGDSVIEDKQVDNASAVSTTSRQY